MTSQETMQHCANWSAQNAPRRRAARPICLQIIVNMFGLRILVFLSAAVSSPRKLNSHRPTRCDATKLSLCGVNSALAIAEGPRGSSNRPVI